MPVYRGNAVTLDLEHVLHRLKITDMQTARNKKFVEALKDGLELVHLLALPQVVYREQGYTLVPPDEIILEGSTVLKSGMVSGKLSDALHVMTGIATIGRGLEKKAQEIKQENGLTASFALEALAAIALDSAVEEFFTGFEAEHSNGGRYSGILMSPGETAGWLVEDQRTIYEMHREELPDMTITDACLLIPKNSISFLVGVFDYEVKKPEEGHCSYCSMRDKCIYKRG